MALTTHDATQTNLVAHLVAAQNEAGPVWDKLPSDKRTNKPKAAGADDDLIPRVEQAIGNAFPGNEKANIMTILHEYGVCKRISDNNYYSRSRRALDIVIEAGGVDEAIATTKSFRAISHTAMKAAYFTIAGLDPSKKADWRTRMRNAGLESMIRKNGERLYQSNPSPIIALWDDGMVTPIRASMRQMLDHIINEAVKLLNARRPHAIITRDELKLKAYGVMAVHMRSEGLLDSYYANVTELRRDWLRQHPTILSTTTVTPTTAATAPSATLPMPSANQTTVIVDDSDDDTAIPTEAPIAPAQMPSAISNPFATGAFQTQPITDNPALSSPYATDAFQPTNTNSAIHKRTADAAAESAIKKQKKREVFQEQLDATMAKLDATIAKLNDVTGRLGTLTTEMADKSNECNVLTTRCDALEGSVAALQASVYRHTQFFRIVHNMPADAPDGLNVQANIRAAVVRAFYPTGQLEPMFQSMQAMKSAWDNLHLFEMDNTIGQVDGERYACNVYRRGLWRFAYIKEGPWNGFEKAIDMGGALNHHVHGHDDGHGELAGHHDVVEDSTDEWDSSSQD